MPVPYRKKEVRLALWSKAVVTVGAVSTALLAGVLAAVEFFAIRNPGRFWFGIFWTAISLNAAVAAVAVLRETKWWLGPALAAVLSGAVLSLDVMWFDRLSPEPEKWLPLVWLLLGVSLIGIVPVFTAAHVGPVKTWKVTVAAVIPLAGVLQFWYTTQYAPRFERAHITMSASLDRGNPPRTFQAGYLALQGTITIKNDSKARVQVLGSIYRVTALSVPALAEHNNSLVPGEETELAESFEWVQNDRPFRSGPSAIFPRLVQADEVVPVTVFFEPGEQWSTTFVVLVPDGPYNTVSLRAQVAVGNKARLVTSDPRMCFDTGAKDPKFEAGRPVLGPVPFEVTDDGASRVCVEQGVTAQSATERIVADQLLVRRELVVADPPDANGNRSEYGSVPELSVWVADQRALEDLFYRRRGRQGSEQSFLNAAQRQQERYGIVGESSDYQLTIVK